MINKTQKQFNSQYTLQQYAHAAWLNLGILNANRHAPIKPEQLDQYLMAGGQLAIQESYPIFAWCLENNIKRFSGTPANEEKLSPLFESLLGAARLADILISRTSKCSSTSRRILAEPHPIENKYTFKVGEHLRAIEFLRSWLESQDTDYLKICDSCFSIEDIEALELVLHVNPECKISVLTSNNKLNSQQHMSLQEICRSKWRQISEQNPPYTEITIVSTEGSGEPPIPDQWWITQSGGLRLGTSFSSLGIDKCNEVFIPTERERENIEVAIDQYLSRSLKEYHNQRIFYTLFTL